MQLSPQLIFPPFRLDPANKQLWRADQLVPLRAKPFAVLCYLTEHPGRLVTQDELRTAVWGNIHVSEAILRVNIREVRAALTDNASDPQLIETVPGCGYCFIASVQRSIQGAGVEPSQVATIADNPQVLVGRSAELLQLSYQLAQAVGGKCQVVSIVGEAGIGKSSLIKAFLEQAGVDHELWIGRGQCVDHQGSSEPYLALLDLLGWLCNSPDGAEAIDILRRHAPTWLAQLPGLI
ncbi:MAG TPA: winged helix-turn-helix domain-containing protein, partial [Candidatus Binataceae bacterium]|nr:winged helix-turn-helix domain-containing protein [Candidatus Binataceae bacterium]